MLNIIYINILPVFLTFINIAIDFYICGSHWKYIGQHSALVRVTKLFLENLKLRYYILNQGYNNSLNKK